MTDADTDVMTEPGLHLFAKMALHLESIKARMDGAEQRELRRLMGLPTYQTIEQMSAPSGATDVVDLGAPQPGRTWIVRLLGAVGATGPSLSVPTNNHVANPATGADWTFTVPTGQTITLQSIAATLTTAVAVANRVVSILIQDPSGNTVFTWVSPFTQTASLADTYMGFNGAANPAAPTGGVLTFDLPNMTLGAGWVIKSSTAAIQAADQWSAINLSYVLTQGAGTVAWYVGQKVITSPGVLPTTSQRGQTTVPGFQNYTSNVVQVLPHQHLIAGLTGLPTGSFTALIVGYNEEPLWKQAAAPVSIE